MPKQQTMDRAELALAGGTPVRKGAFAPWPYFAPEEVEAVAEVLRSGKVNYWTGETGRQFEREFAEYCGSKYAIALANGTVALELALLSLGIGEGDEVITTSRTFIASASSAVMRRAIPVMADVDPITQNITADTIRSRITGRTRAVIVVHLAGWPCDMDSIMALARDHDLKVIEDCAQALGASYKGKRVGTFGHAAAFSFCQDKILTTGGEGGMLTTNDRDVWERAWSFKDHGKSWSAVYQRQHPPGFRWLHETFGTNWRLSEMQSAVGRVQLQKVDNWVDRRRMFAETLNARLSKVGALRVTVPPQSVRHSYYKYYVFVKPDALKDEWSRDRIIEAINAEGVPCFSGSCSEIYLERAFADHGLTNERLPVARELGETSLMFLVHPTLADSDIADTAAAIEKVMAEAAR